MGVLHVTVEHRYVGRYCSETVTLLTVTLLIAHSFMLFEKKHEKFVAVLSPV